MTLAQLNNNEQVVWEGTPSQWTNFAPFFVCTLFCWLGIPLLIILWRWLVVKNTKYVLTNERLFTYRGVLNKHVDELELYRVKDYAQFRPLLMRLVGLGCVSVVTSDRTHSVVNLNGIKDAGTVQGLLRNHVEACRQRRGVRELDA